VEGRVDELVEEVEELENQRAELVDKLVIKIIKVVTEVYTRGQEASVGMTWEDFKAFIREEFCPNNEMQKLETKFWFHAIVGVGHAAYTDRFQDLASLSVVLKVGVLTDEEIRNGSLKKSTKKRGNGGDLSRDGNFKDYNKRSKTGRAFSIITNPVRKDYTVTAPKFTNCNFHHNLKTSCCMCMKCNRFWHIAKDCKAATKMVNPLKAKTLTATRGACFECGGTDHYKVACPMLNRAPRQGGNRPNQAMAIEGGQGHGNNGNPAHIEPSNLGFSYEIKIASGQLILINKVIYGCKLEIEGRTFDIDLILFGHESFNVIVGMDWLSMDKAEIVCHEKVVRIPLAHGEMLRVVGERPEEKVKHLMSAKAEGQKLEEIIVVRNFSEPAAISLPLVRSDHGTSLHVSILLLSAKTGLREFDQQRDNGLQSRNNVDKDTKPNTSKSSSSELKMLDDLEMNNLWLLPTSLLWSDHRLVEDHEKWHMGIYTIVEFIAGLFSFYMEFSTGHVSLYARISEMFVRSMMLKVYVEIAKSSQCIIVLLTCGCGFCLCNKTYIVDKGYMDVEILMFKIAMLC
nr:hypothetical protein [Tanacetum cinerariifolium]